MGSFTPPPTTALAPGDRLDRYELLCVLAQGGMGTVWLARLSGKHGFERLVALKTILPTFTNDRQFCDMFLDEARIAAQIDHENVARILEIGEDRGLLYYAMELIDGHSLRKLYRDVRGVGHWFPMGIAMRVVADACAGLHATHELHGEDGRPLDVVHRDVSPQNILVTVRGTVKLIDFGVAKARARRSEETAAGTLKGKIEYMAPEQARGDPLDRRADVYALGAVLYELLAGRPVRDTDDGKQLAALHDLMTGAPYVALPPQVPDLVRGIVDRALARDPNARFATAEELRRALENAMIATGAAATPEDVASVLAAYSRERTARRKDAIDQAIRLAEEGRLHAATLIQPLAPPSGLSAPPPSYRTPMQPGMTTRIHDAHHGAMAPASFPPGADGPGTGPSMRTVGGAALSAPPPARGQAAKVVLLVFALAVVGLLGGVAGVIVTKRGGEARAIAVGTAPATPTAATATATANAVSANAAQDPAPPQANAAAPTTPPVAAIDPPAPATGTAVVAVRDAGATTASTAAPATTTTSTSTSRPAARPPPSPNVHRPPVRPGAKPADGDEYGF